jgi:hypothetical protein
MPSSSRAAKASISDRMTRSGSGITLPLVGHNVEDAVGRYDRARCTA